MVLAELSGDDTCRALGVTVRSSAPVLTLCRKLVEAGHNPATPLEAYSGAVLCLKVRSIGEGTRLRVAPSSVGFKRERWSSQTNQRPCGGSWSRLSPRGFRPASVFVSGIKVLRGTEPSSEAVPAGRESSVSTSLRSGQGVMESDD
jgi:hypothetical protein